MVFPDRKPKKNLKKCLDKMTIWCYNIEAVGKHIVYLGVAQLVARYLGVVEAAGSSPVTQIEKSGNDLFPDFFIFRCHLHVFTLPQHPTSPQISDHLSRCILFSTGPLNRMIDGLARG